MGLINKILFNIKKILSEPEVERHSNCLYCNRELIGNQRKFCSTKCSGYFYRNYYLIKNGIKCPAITKEERDFSILKSKAQKLAYKHYPSLKKIKCEICGKKAEFRHHKDYNKPLDIIFLCCECHGKVHSGNYEIIKKLMEKNNSSNEQTEMKGGKIKDAKKI